MGDIFDQVATQKQGPSKGGGDIFDKVTSAPGYTGNFKKDIGGPKAATRLPSSELRDERERGAPQGGLRDLYSGAKGILGSMKSIIEPHENAHYGASMEAEKAMGPIGRALFNIPADTAQSLENAEVARQQAKKAGGGIGKQAGAYAGQLPIIGSLISDVKEDRPMKALGEIGTIVAGPKVSREAGKVGAAKMAEYLPATQKYVSDTLNQYATGVAGRHLQVAPNSETGMNVGLTVARNIEPFERMKELEKKFSEVSTREQAKFTDKAIDATKAGVVVDVLPEFTEVAKKVNETLTEGYSPGHGDIGKITSFLDHWNKNGRLGHLTPVEAQRFIGTLDTIVRDPPMNTPPLVGKLAEKLRNIIDQKMDKQVMGWKDHRHAASELIQASERAREITTQKWHGKVAQQLRVFASIPLGNEPIAAPMEAVYLAATATLGYLLAEEFGGGMGGHIAAVTGVVTGFRMMAKSLSSAEIRMKFATRFADLLYKEKQSGPSSYPPQAGPGMGLVPVGGPQGLPPAQQGQLSPQRVQELMEQAKKESETPKSGGQKK